MDTLSFFQSVLPRQGLICLAEFAPGKKPIHRFYEQHDAAAAAARTIDATGKTIYHACATFLTDKSRKQDNAGWMRAFWIDADVEPGNPEKYETLKDALVDIGRVCKELQLPLPLIVNSGMGAHAYWTLDADIEAGDWGLVAGRFKSALEHLGFRQDRTRTADSASVLRPVGTHWRKQSERAVRSLSGGSPISPELFAARIASYESRVGASFGGYNRLGGAGPNNFTSGLIHEDDLGSPREYPGSSAERIRTLCATLAHVADAGGNVEEPLWRAMLGLVRFTTEGAECGHAWSSGHPEYSYGDTQEKIDRWTAGPTTCAHFRGTNGNKCTGCPHQVSSPIHLGYSEETVAPAVVVTPDAEPEVPLYWPKKHFFWTGHALCRAVKDDQDMVKWVPFCDTLFYPTKRVRDEEGTWHLRIRHLSKDRVWGEFGLPAELIGSQQGLAGGLAAQEVFVYGKNGVPHVKEYLRQYALELQTHGVQQLTYAKMGWADNYNSFVIGNQAITKDESISILPGDHIRGAGWDKDFGVAGTLDEWTRLIDLIYNRPNAEPYQFAIGCALAAPLIELTEATNWHGIPIALTGDSALGKTTACKVAVSIYGRPDNMLVSAGNAGATLNAMVTRIGTARNLPVVFDELTQRDHSEVSAFLYMLSSGRPKDRNRADGTIIDLGMHWNTVTFITSNDNVTELLFLLEEKSVTEATQLRVFEIAIDRDLVSNIWGGTNAVDLIEHQLLENYGHAGRAWLRYVIENRATLKDEVRKLRAKYNPNSSEDTRERYYRDLIATTIVALKHAASIGLVKFDVVKVAKWAKQNIMKLRVRRSEHSFTAEEYIAHFLSTLHGRTVITKYLKDGRTGVESALEPLRQAPIARLALEDKVCMILRKGLADWCSENRLQYTWILQEMEKRKLLRLQSDGTFLRKDRIGRGTSIPSTQAAVFELEYDKVVGSLGISDK